MGDWFFRKSGGVKTGPYSIAQIKIKAQKNPTAEAMEESVMDWTSVQSIDALNISSPHIAQAQAQSQPQSIQAELQSSSNNNITSQQVRDYPSEGVDYRIFGTEMQFVEIEFDPGESVVAEAGALMYKDPQVAMETVFGDGSEAGNEGFLGLLAGAGRRLITGESMFTTIFTHQGQGKVHASFAAPYAGNIIPFYMKDCEGTIICQKDAFLCASKGIAIGIHFSKKIMTGLFGGEGFILQKLTADPNDAYAIAFVHAGGTIIEKELKKGQVLEIDTGALVAMTTNIDFDVRYVGNVKSALFGGEGLFLGVLTAKGTGRVWLQSLPFSRLAARILSNAQGSFGARSGGESSMLGSLGGLIGGNNR